MWNKLICPSGKTKNKKVSLMTHPKSIFQVILIFFFLTRFRQQYKRSRVVLRNIQVEEKMLCIQGKRSESEAKSN